MRQNCRDGAEAEARHTKTESSGKRRVLLSPGKWICGLMCVRQIHTRVVKHRDGNTRFLLQTKERRVHDGYGCCFDGSQLPIIIYAVRPRITVVYSNFHLVFSCDRRQLLHVLSNIFICRKICITLNKKNCKTITVTLTKWSTH